MFCRHCGNTLFEGSPTCAYCNAPVGAGTSFCPACANPSAATDNHCGKCGIPLHQQPNPYQSQFNQYNGMFPQNDSNRGIAIASMILGIIGLISFTTMVFPIILGTLALIFGIMGLKSTRAKGMAITGVALGSISLLSAVMFLAIFILAAYSIT